jgi:hypothetical protein
LFCTDLLPNCTAAKRDAVSEGTAGAQLGACAVLLLHWYKAGPQVKAAAGALYTVLCCALSMHTALLVVAAGTS